MIGRRITLDNPVFTGRRKAPSRQVSFRHRAAAPRTRRIGDVLTATTSSAPKKAQPKTVALKAVAAVQAHTPRTTRSQVLKRQAVKRTSIRRRRRGSLQNKALAFVAMLLFIFGVSVGVMSLRTNHKVAAQVQKVAQAAPATTPEATDAEVPSEVKPPSLDAYRVAPDMPRVITIPKYDVKSRILRMGTNSKGAFAAPSSIHDAGWYDGSSKPGEGGAVLLDGHVSGPTQHGVFYNLKNLVKGDAIQIERGDGKVINYTVVTSKAYDADKVDMAAALTPVTAGKKGLNLITCSGQINSKNEYKQRTIVFAVQQ